MRKSCENCKHDECLRKAICDDCYLTSDAPTNNEIVKALENNRFAYDEHMNYVFEQTLSLINRQKAEIERLTQGIERLADESDARDIDEYNMVCRVRVDAIKQFADGLKAIYNGDNRYDRPNAHTLIVKLFDNIDNLVKEMVGEDK